MSVYSIWESQFPSEAAEEGISVTKAIWQDMLACDGYLGHELVEDLDQPGHLLVISRWASREAADAALSYRPNPNPRLPANRSAGPAVARSPPDCDPCRAGRRARQRARPSAPPARAGCRAAGRPGGRGRRERTAQAACGRARA